MFITNIKNLTTVPDIPILLDNMPNEKAYLLEDLPNTSIFCNVGIT